MVKFAEKRSPFPSPVEQKELQQYEVCKFYIQYPYSVSIFAPYYQCTGCTCLYVCLFVACHEVRSLLYVYSGLCKWTGIGVPDVMSMHCNGRLRAVMCCPPHISKQSQREKDMFFDCIWTVDKSWKYSFVLFSPCMIFVQWYQGGLKWCLSCSLPIRGLRLCLVSRHTPINPLKPNGNCRYQLL
jgi:hypothetical protein